MYVLFLFSNLKVGPDLGVVLALFAGLLAATASVLGKLATHPSVSQFAQDHFASYPQVRPTNQRDLSEINLMYHQVVLLFRGALMITTVFINVVMLNWFVKAMDLTNSVFAAVANTASNIFCSVLYWSIKFLILYC
mgnify:FL=1